VNHWAPDQQTHKVDDPAVLHALRRKYALPDGVGYILAFGAEDPRKNTPAIVRAWSQVSEAVRRQCHLLIVGLQPAALGRMQAFANPLVPDGSCRIHGFADEADIALSQVWVLESGRGDPTLSTLLTIAKALGVTLSDLDPSID